MTRRRFPSPTLRLRSLVGRATRAACMPQKSCPEIFVWSFPPLALLSLYVAAYLLSTEVFHGRLRETRYCIRLFRTAWHHRAFQPLWAVEERLRPLDPEF